MKQIYLLCEYYKKYSVSTKYVQNTLQYNHIFKVVNIILKRSVKNMLSLLTQRERSIILCSGGMDLLGVLGEGVLCEILGNYQTK